MNDIREKILDIFEEIEELRIHKGFRATYAYEYFKIDSRIKGIATLTYEELEELLYDVNKFKDTM